MTSITYDSQASIKSWIVASGDATVLLFLGDDTMLWPDRRAVTWKTASHLNPLCQRGACRSGVKAWRAEEETYLDRELHTPLRGATETKAQTNAPLKYLWQWHLSHIWQKTKTQRRSWSQRLVIWRIPFFHSALKCSVAECRLWQFPPKSTSLSGVEGKELKAAEGHSS